MSFSPQRKLESSIGRQVDRVDRMLQSQQSLIKQLLSSLSYVAPENELFQTEIAQMVKRFDDMNNEIINDTENFSAFDVSYSQTLSRFENIEKELEELRRDRKDHVERELQVSDLQIDLEAIKEQVSASSSAIQSPAKSPSRSSSTSANAILMVKNALMAKVDKVNNHVKRYEENTTKEIRNLRSDVDTLSMHGQEYHQEFTKLGAKIQSVQIMLNYLKDQLAIGSDRSLNESQIRQIQNEISTMKDALNSSANMKKNLSGFEKNIEKLKGKVNKIDELKSAQEKCEKDVESILDQLKNNSMNASNADSAQIEKIKSAQDKCEKEIESILDQLKNNPINTSNIDFSQIDSMKEKLEEHEKAVKKLEEQTADLIKSRDEISFPGPVSTRDINLDLSNDETEEKPVNKSSSDSDSDEKSNKQKKKSKKSKSKSKTQHDAKSHSSSNDEELSPIKFKQMNDNAFNDRFTEMDGTIRQIIKSSNSIKDHLINQTEISNKHENKLNELKNDLAKLQNEVNEIRGFSPSSKFDGPRSNLPLSKYDDRRTNHPYTEYDERRSDHPPSEVDGRRANRPSYEYDDIRGSRPYSEYDDRRTDQPLSEVDGRRANQSSSECDERRADQPHSEYEHRRTNRPSSEYDSRSNQPYSHTHGNYDNVHAETPERFKHLELKDAINQRLNEIEGTIDKLIETSNSIKSHLIKQAQISNEHELKLNELLNEIDTLQGGSGNKLISKTRSSKPLNSEKSGLLGQNEKFDSSDDSSNSESFTISGKDLNIGDLINKKISQMDHAIKKMADSNGTIQNRLIDQSQISNELEHKLNDLRKEVQRIKKGANNGDDSSSDIDSHHDVEQRDISLNDYNDASSDNDNEFGGKPGDRESPGHSKHDSKSSEDSSKGEKEHHDNKRKIKSSKRTSKGGIESFDPNNSDSKSKKLNAKIESLEENIKMLLRRIETLSSEQNQIVLQFNTLVPRLRIITDAIADIKEKMRDLHNIDIDNLSTKIELATQKAQDVATPIAKPLTFNAPGNELQGASNVDQLVIQIRAIEKELQFHAKNVKALTKRTNILHKKMKKLHPDDSSESDHNSSDSEESPDVVERSAPILDHTSTFGEGTDPRIERLEKQIEIIQNNVNSLLGFPSQNNRENVHTDGDQIIPTSYDSFSQDSENHPLKLEHRVETLEANFKVMNHRAESMARLQYNIVYQYNALIPQLQHLKEVVARLQNQHKQWEESNNNNWSIPSDALSDISPLSDISKQMDELSKKVDTLGIEINALKGMGQMEPIDFYERNVDVPALDINRHVFGKGGSSDSDSSNKDKKEEPGSPHKDSDYPTFTPGTNEKKVLLLSPSNRNDQLLLRLNMLEDKVNAFEERSINTSVSQQIIVESFNNLNPQLLQMKNIVNRILAKQENLARDVLAKSPNAGLDLSELWDEINEIKAHLSGSSDKPLMPASSSDDRGFLSKVRSEVKDIEDQIAFIKNNSGDFSGLPAMCAKHSEQISKLQKQVSLLKRISKSKQTVDGQGDSSDSDSASSDLGDKTPEVINRDIILDSKSSSSDEKKDNVKPSATLSKSIDLINDKIAQLEKKVALMEGEDKSNEEDPTIRNRIVMLENKYSTFTSREAALNALQNQLVVQFNALVPLVRKANNDISIIQAKFKHLFPQDIEINFADAEWARPIPSRLAPSKKSSSSSSDDNNNKENEVTHVSHIYHDSDDIYKKLSQLYVEFNSISSTSVDWAASINNLKNDVNQLKEIVDDISQKIPNDQSSHHSDQTPSEPQQSSNSSSESEH